MTYSTTNVYRMKREIITFSKKISSCLPRTEQKFFADMLYGMLGSGSCLYNGPWELDHGIEKMREHGIMRLTKGRSANHVIQNVHVGIQGEGSH